MWDLAPQIDSENPCALGLPVSVFTFAPPSLGGEIEKKNPKFEISAEYSSLSPLFQVSV